MKGASLTVSLWQFQLKRTTQNTNPADSSRFWFWSGNIFITSVWISPMMLGVILLLWYLLCRSKKNRRKFIHAIVINGMWSHSGNSLMFKYSNVAASCLLPNETASAKGSIYHIKHLKALLNVAAAAKRERDKFLETNLSWFQYETIKCPHCSTFIKCQSVQFY